MRDNSCVVSNFEEFFNLLDIRGGLIIIYPEEKINDVRNNIIRASNNNLCSFIKDTTIFPIINNSETAKELIKVFSPKNYPFYIFCKHEIRKNKKIINIKSCVEKKFLLKDVAKSLFRCFPRDSNITKDICKKLKGNLDTLDTSITIMDETVDFTESIDEIKKCIKILRENLNYTLFEDRNPQSPNSNNPFHNSPPNLNKDNAQLDKFIDNNNKNNTKMQDNETTICTNIKLLDITINDFDICKISFIYPNGEKYFEKEFNKNDKIVSLFNFVESLGRDIYSNQNSNCFELIHDYPPKKLSEKKNITLMEEGLFPSSIVYIIEKQKINLNK